MKYLVGIVIAATAAACSIDHRSGDFECQRQQDCSGGRQCVDGLCIDLNAPDAPGPDGNTSRPDARPDARPECPAQCTSCDLEQLTCIIDCSVSGDCGEVVTCPTGYTCEILCNIQNSCRNGVNCNNAKGCAVTCSGTSSCRDVECGDGPCEVGCSGFQSCRNIHCNNSCACDVDCSGPQSCPDGIVCSDFQCDIGLGCSSLIPGCNTCGG